MAQFGTDIAEDLQLLDIKMKQLKNEYEQYFLGSRKREPGLLRGEVQKMVTLYANTPIQNTGFRFKFNNLRARYFSFRRHWDDTLRKIEAGTYERHIFKAKLHEKEPPPKPKRRKPRGETHASGDASLYEAYVAARSACGQDNAGMSADKLSRVLEQQANQIRQKHGCEKVRFRVVVQEGRAKLKAVTG